MKNIILLGHKSSIGNSFYNAFKNRYNFLLIDKPIIDANKKNTLKKIIKKINIKKQYILINCVGMMIDERCTVDGKPLSAGLYPGRRG